MNGVSNKQTRHSFVSLYKCPIWEIPSCLRRRIGNQIIYEIGVTKNAFKIFCSCEIGPFFLINLKKPLHALDLLFNISPEGFYACSHTQNLKFQPTLPSNRGQNSMDYPFTTHCFAFPCACAKSLFSFTKARRVFIVQTIFIFTE